MTLPGDPLCDCAGGLVHLPLLYVTATPTVLAWRPREPALDTLADVLGGSASSMLYQALVKTGKARGRGLPTPASWPGTPGESTPTPIRRWMAASRPSKWTR